MPLKLALIALPPVSVTCAVVYVLYLAGIPWIIIGRIATVSVVLLFITELCYRWRARAREQRLFEQDPETVSITVLPREPAVGLGLAAIASLPVYKYEKMRCGDEGGDECPVCLGEIRPSEVVKQMPARTHLFHEACIDVWLWSHRTCPVCRSQVDTSNLPAVEVTVRVQSLES